MTLSDFDAADSPPRYQCSSVLRGHTDAAMACDLTSDGCTIVSAACDKTLRLWRRTRESDSELWTSTALRGHTDWTRRCFFSADEEAIVSCSMVTQHACTMQRTATYTDCPAEALNFRTRRSPSGTLGPCPAPCGYADTLRA